MSAFVELQVPAMHDTVTLSEERYSIGRGGSNSISNPDDATLSSLHAVLERVAGTWCVRDLDSSNGTFVNGKRVLGGTPLTDGDEIRVGATRMVFRDEDRRPATRTEPTKRPPELTPEERRVLVALCAPKLEGSMLAEPASVEQVVERLASSTDSVDQVLVSLRERFDADSDRTLAEEAILRGAVGPADLGGAPSFVREGEVWTLSYGAVTFRLKDTKGLRYLHVLLSHAGRELFVGEVAAAAEGIAEPTPGSRVGGELTVTPGEEGFAVLDDAAKAAYKARVEELREQIREGEAFGDPERVSRARAELQMVTEELARSVGLGGRDRKTSAQVERTRVNVTRAIRTAIDKISGFSPALADHLDASVSTGRFCVYESDDVPSWNL